jgi:hypothetical protein
METVKVLKEIMRKCFKTLFQQGYFGQDLKSACNKKQKETSGNANQCKKKVHSKEINKENEETEPTKWERLSGNYSFVQNI